MPANVQLLLKEDIISCQESLSEEADEDWGMRDGIEKILRGIKQQNN